MYLLSCIMLPFTCAVPSKIVDSLSSRDQTVREGDTVTLVCNVTGVPTPEVTWYKLPSEGLHSSKERKDTVVGVVNSCGNADAEMFIDQLLILEKLILC